MLKQITKAQFNTMIGSVGSIIGIAFFLSNIQQIIANLHGDKGQILPPLTATISSIIWVIYGLTKEPQKDYILIIPNTLGIIICSINFITCLL